MQPAIILIIISAEVDRLRIIARQAFHALHTPIDRNHILSILMRVKCNGNRNGVFLKKKYKKERRLASVETPLNCLYGAEQIMTCNSTF